MSELKPCPFCGGEVEIEKTINGQEWFGVVCRNTENRGGTCAIEQIPSASREAAVDRWNTRTPQSESVGSELKELREFRMLAFEAHPNIDIDIDYIKFAPKQ